MYSVSSHTRTSSLKHHTPGMHTMAGTIMWCGIPVFILFSLTNLVTSFSPKCALMSRETKKHLKLETLLLLLYLFQYLVTSMHKLNYFFRTCWTRFFSCEGTFHADGFICHVVASFYYNPPSDGISFPMHWYGTMTLSWEYSGTLPPWY